MDSCKRHLSRKVLKEAFLLTYDRMRRYEGAWHLESRLMFPEYVLLESENEEFLIKELGKCGTVKFKKTLVRLTPEEEKFLKRLYGDRYHLKMSRGIYFKGTTRITEGPLKGMENRICKVDRHKRLAYIQMAAGRSGHCTLTEAVGKNEKFPYVLAGLEITEKFI